MSLKYGKKEVGKVVAVLDGDFESVEDAAKGVLAVVEEIFEDRASFVVVGQLCGTREREQIPPSDPEAIKVSLGWYSTEGDATKAAESLYTNAGSGDRYRVWVLPVFHGTPGDLHDEAKAAYAAAEAVRQEKRDEKFRESVEKHRQAMEERARGGKGSCEGCGHHPYDHVTAGNGRGKCALTGCGCPKWKEKAK